MGGWEPLPSGGLGPEYRRLKSAVSVEAGDDAFQTTPTRRPADPPEAGPALPKEGAEAPTRIRAVHDKRRKLMVELLRETRIYSFVGFQKRGRYPYSGSRSTTGASVSFWGTVDT